MAKTKGKSKKSKSGSIKSAGKKFSKKVNTALMEQTPEREVSVVDLILLDHKFLKECIEVLSNEEAPRTEVLSKGKLFLQVLEKHSKGEEKTIYPDLENRQSFHFNILESEIEHGIVDQKVKSLKPKVARAKSANDSLAAELKVVAELVKHHIREEESELLPKIKSEIDQEELFNMGSRFLKVRKFTEEELAEFPELPKALEFWKEEMKDLSTKFMTKMDKYVEALKQ